MPGSTQDIQRPTSGGTVARAIRVMHVVGYAGADGQTFGMTGIERAVQLLLEGLDRRQFEQYVTYPEVGQLFAVYKEHALAMHSACARSHYDRNFITTLAEALIENNIDVVMSYGMRLDFHTAHACRRARVPHLVNRPVALADEQMSGPRKWLFSLVDRWTVARCHAVVACSKASAQRMIATQRISENKIVVIPNGVDLPPVQAGAREAARKHLGIDPHAVVIGGVGQLIPRKAFHLLIEAIANLQSTAPLVCCLLGDGPERSRLEQLAADKKITLVMPGFVRNPYQLMMSFDLNVLPSQAEGMPLVVLESMALGIPTVATNVAGTPEVIEQDESGSLVEPNDVAGLTLALQTLLDEPQRRARYSRNGMRHTRQRFGLDVMVQSFAECLAKYAKKGF